MAFDMNRAWSGALALLRTNRELIAVVAGMFFLLPDLVTGMVFADMIARATQDFTAAMLAARQAQQALDIGLTSAMRQALALSCAIGLIKLFGISTVIALLDGRARPTLGQALALAGRSMPGLIAAILLFAAGYVLGSLLIALAASPFAALLGTAAAGSLVAAVFAGFLIYAMTRLSLTLPVIVLEKILNPLAAFAGSWALTRGRALALFGFYFLLGLGYLVLALPVEGMLLPGLREVLGGGTAGTIITSLIGGLVSALVLALLACIVAAIYRQIAGAASGNPGGRP